ncbi:ATP-binding protein [Longimicrobium sp.]|uniref:ATP-binding protein n=1 Tax=Longimicrobium sp. TaxID=2029185 RepID=UPI002CD81061|nr:ATP-binding protein [Longimicrobium sp.]HSU15892.1 ATP-binding protein [Longimicrobium sp.]
MTRVVTVPQTLNGEAFEGLLAEAADAGDEKLLFDARHVRFADPYGMLGLLAIGTYIGETGGRPMLDLPQSPEVVRYFGGMGFLSAAAIAFEMAPPRGRNPESGALLPITVINSADDVHAVVNELNEGRVSALLTEQLGHSKVDAIGFSVLLSEVSQNIIEHAAAPGWVGIQTYRRWKGIDRRVAVIAVMDLGVGFKGSLEREHAARFGDRWGDATALEAAFIHGVTRFREPGRGQGLKQIRKRVGKWGGKISIRSGTSRIADVPEWDDALPLAKDLPYFPGAQIEIILPAREAAPAPPPAAPAPATRAAAPPRRPPPG